MIVASRFDIRIRQQEDGQDDCDRVPSWEDEAVVSAVDALAYVKVSTASPDLSGSK